MNRTKKKSLFILLLILALASIPGTYVFAAADAPSKDEIEQEVESFLNNIYTVSDEGLETLRGTDSFYEIVVRSWYEDREITGDFVELVSTEAEDPSNGQIIVNSVAEFENYTSDIVIFFDEKEMRPMNYVMNIRYSMGEKMTQAAQNMAVGLIVVFAVLVFLMFIISLFRFFAPKKKEDAKEPVPAAAAVPVPAALSASEQLESGNSNDEEIAAVIAAAIAAASEDAPSPTGYVVKSVKRGARSLWKRV